MQKKTWTLKKYKASLKKNAKKCILLIYSKIVNILKLLYPQRLFNMALPKIKKIVDNDEKREGIQKAREGGFLSYKNKVHL